MGSGYCGLGNPRPAVILVGIVDIILSLILLLLCIVALGDLKKVAGLLERDSLLDDAIYGDGRNSILNEEGRHQNDSLHGVIVLVLINTLVTLVLAIGLFVGVQKEMDCPVKSWLIHGCTMLLLGIITILVMAVATGQGMYFFLGIPVFIRMYEFWVVLEYLKGSRYYFNPKILSRTSSTERLHSV